MKDILKWVTLVGIFAVPFLTLYVENEYFFPFITGKNFWFRIIVDVTLVAWIALACYEPRYRPKWSWLLGGAGVLLGVMFLANLLGEHPASSFWSNFERMDGYVSLVHAYLYMLIVGSVLQTRQVWAAFFVTSVTVAFAVAMQGVFQYLGWLPGGARVDSTLGNAAYMSVYMLFHIGLCVWLLLQKVKLPTWFYFTLGGTLFLATFVFGNNVLQANPVELSFYLFGLWLVAYYFYPRFTLGLLLPFFAFVLVETGTRGTAIGLATGLVVAAIYFVVCAKQEEYQLARKVAAGGLLVLFTLVVGLVAAKDTDFVQNNSNLSRIANISFTEDLEIRRIVWGMAWAGVQERPLLGWGQSNFNYVFNEQYDPRLYAQEQWFDRAHNIILDWLIAGGLLGLLAYLSLFVACVYYLVVRPLLKPDDTFTVAERAVLLGILAGYFTHNLVVFDNIISYIFFAAILGLIHFRVSRPFRCLDKRPVDPDIVNLAVLPVGAVACVAVIWFVHAPGMAAAGDLIDAFQALPPQIENQQALERGLEGMLEEFQSALDRGSFANQEITEQLSQQTIRVVQADAVSAELKDSFTATTVDALERLVANKPDDARVYVFVASHYWSIGELERAATEFAKARSLSRQKQSIISQQAALELARGNQSAAHEFRKQAFELEPKNLGAREDYITSFLRQGDAEAALELIDSSAVWARLANSEAFFNTARAAGALEILPDLYQVRIDRNPTVAQNWASLAFVYFEQGDRDAAVSVLREGIEVVSSPEFTVLATCIADNIATGKSDPQTGC